MQIRRALTREQRAQYDEQGSCACRASPSPTSAKRMLDRVVALARAHAGGDRDAPGLVLPEANLAGSGGTPRGPRVEDLPPAPRRRVRRLRRRPAGDRDDRRPVGPHLDCFLSQFIFKNPGAWGQPWHQDSFYFAPFEPARPIVGAWLAVTEATLENGCLHVLPGSHREPVHEHVPDRRPNANLGYVEIVDHDMAAAEPVLMDPGDLLLFDSHLMHRSTDNESSGSAPRWCSTTPPPARSTAARARSTTSSPSADPRPPRRPPSPRERMPVTETPAATRLHPWNTRLHLDRPPGPVPDPDRRPGGAVRRARVSSCCRPSSTARRWRGCGPRPIASRTRWPPSWRRSTAGASPSPRRAPSRSPPTWWPGRTSLRALSLHPTIAGICADLVGPDVNLYWDQAVYKKPEKPRRFPWHQDNGYAFVEPQQYLTVWLALTDATLANGCPMVAPGFHRLGTIAHTYVDPLGWECLHDPDGAVAAEVPAGGAVVFSSLTPHLTGPNTTDEVRKAYILQYAPAGAEILRGDPHAGPPDRAGSACDAPERQYPVVVGGGDVPVCRPAPEAVSVGSASSSAEKNSSAVFVLVCCSPPRSMPLPCEERPDLVDDVEPLAREGTWSTARPPGCRRGTATSRRRAGARTSRARASA